MKQQQLTNLALRKIYHAEQLGMPAESTHLLRESVQALNAKIDHATLFIEDEATMLDSMEKSVVLDRRWNEFILQLTELSANVSEWIYMRVRSPGKFKPKANKPQIHQPRPMS